MDAFLSLVELAAAQARYRWAQLAAMKAIRNKDERAYLRARMDAVEQHRTMMLRDQALNMEITEDASAAFGIHLPTSNVAFPLKVRPQ